jgi:phosphoribosyl-dephospho-CoA transferase
MISLRRHQLVYLTDAGWKAVLERPWDAQARDCLSHWAMRRLPLVVTRQGAEVAAAGSIALGLPAPARWDRRRLALHVPRGSVLCQDEFPRIDGALSLLTRTRRSALQALHSGLREACATARVFGSHGWQLLTGLEYLRPGSDLDLWVAVDDAAHADSAAALLRSFASERLRLDGEFVFGDGSAVAWREWADWRAGKARAVMVKHLNGVTLRRDGAWCMGTEQMAVSE